MVNGVTFTGPAQSAEKTIVRGIGNAGEFIMEEAKGLAKVVGIDSNGKYIEKVMEKPIAALGIDPRNFYNNTADRVGKILNYYI